jgi:hypothetical protein
LGPAACGRFHFDPARWSTAGWADRQQLAGTLADCGTLDGRSRTEVRAMVGPVIRGQAGMDLAGGLEIAYDPVGRVASVRAPDGD